MFDLFDFTPVDYDPFKKDGPAPTSGREEWEAQPSGNKYLDEMNEAKPPAPLLQPQGVGPTVYDRPKTIEEYYQAILPKDFPPNVKDYMYGTPTTSIGYRRHAQPSTPKFNDPNLPTHMMPGPMMPRNDLYGDVQPVPSPAWPPGIPRDVQTYMYMNPSYGEGQRQTMMPPSIAGGEPYSSTPQIGDLDRLFSNRMSRNAPTSEGFSAQELRALMQLPGFAGFAGGDEI